MASGTGNLPNQGMSFSPFAILTAEEQNNLVENIESLATGSGIGDSAITTAKIANSAVTSAKIDWTTSGGVWWQEVGRTTLASISSTLSVSFTAKKYLCVIVNIQTTGGTATPFIRFNNDSASNYAYRYSGNGAADVTATSQNSIIGFGASFPVQRILDITNNASAEKIVYIRDVVANNTGAGNVPGRNEVGAKWANTSTQISRIDIFTTGGGGSFNVGSEIVVLAHD